MVQGNVLIIDDEPAIGHTLLRAFSSEGFFASYCQDASAGLEFVESEPVDVVISDVRMPGIDGLEFLRLVKESKPECDVVLMTAHATVDVARLAMKGGAADIIIKPFSMEKVMKPLVFELLGEARRRDHELGPRIHLDRTTGEHVARKAVVGRGRAMRGLLERVEKIAPCDSSVLLLGESGSGKEVVANLIHEISDRASMPFVKVNCAALPESLLESELFGYKKGSFTGAERDREGLFQAADGGTLLLDEIGEISPTFQPKLLRVLQDGEFHRIGDPGSERHVDVRIIASTNRDLEQAVEQGTFRRDLYYRLNVVPIDVPPLRSHLEDLEELLHYFAKVLRPGRSVEITPCAYEAMRSYRWPGNIRELQNTVEYALMLGDGRRIAADDLPASLQHTSRSEPPADLQIECVQGTLESVQRQCILDALAKTHGNQTEAARLLGITRRALGCRVDKYHLREVLERDFQRDDVAHPVGRRKLARVRGARTLREVSGR